MKLKSPHEIKLSGTLLAYYYPVLPFIAVFNLTCPFLSNRLIATGLSIRRVKISNPILQRMRNTCGIEGHVILDVRNTEITDIIQEPGEK
jgi:hypothetical protein